MLATSVLVRQQLQIDRWLLELHTRSRNGEPLLSRLSVELTLHLHVVDVLVLFLGLQEVVPSGGTGGSLRSTLRELLNEASEGLLSHRRVGDLRWLFGLQCTYERDHVLPRMRRVYSIDTLAALGSTMDQMHRPPDVRAVLETSLPPANDRSCRTGAQA